VQDYKFARHTYERIITDTFQEWKRILAYFSNIFHNLNRMPFGKKKADRFTDRLFLLVWGAEITLLPP
jgi:hypothetical protein